jgi:hypothetical protein
MSSYVYAVVLGLAFAFYICFSSQRRLHNKLHQRFPDLIERWCKLDRRTRRRLTKDMRTGQTVPVEHAEVVIGMIDLSVTLEAERLPTFRRRVTHGYGSYLLVLVVLVVAFVFSDAGFRFIEVIYITTCATILVRLTIGVVPTRSRLRTWPVNRSRTREQAVLDLAAAESGGLPTGAFS